MVLEPILEKKYNLMFSIMVEKEPMILTNLIL